MCELEMYVTADKTYIIINPLLTLVPRENGLNTAFKPFFDIVLCTEHGLILPFWCLFQTSKCSIGTNNSNVSVCYIINIASKYFLLYSYIDSIGTKPSSLSCSSTIFSSTEFIARSCLYTGKIIFSNLALR